MSLIVHDHQIMNTIMVIVLDQIMNTIMVKKYDSPKHEHNHRDCLWTSKQEMIVEIVHYYCPSWGLIDDWFAILTHQAMGNAICGCVSAIIRNQQ